MRWPLRKRPAGTDRPRTAAPDAPAAAPPAEPARPQSGAADTQSAAPAPRPAAEPPLLHPNRSRPRTDWAHITPLTPVAATPPPLTFDGERFGRSVPGARSLTARHRPAAATLTGPVGILRDVAKVETVIPPVPPAEPGDAGAATGAMPAALPAVHRKVPPATKPTPDQPLTVSDFQPEYPKAELRQPIPTPVTWTPEEGFVEGPVEESSDTTFTMFRRRTPLGQPSDDEAADALEADEPEEPAPTLRFVPAEGPRRVAPPRDLVEAVEQATGVHVGDAVIDRSPEVSTRAAEMGAVAFTERGTVHLPSELGSIDDPTVRAVTAHELVHVAQHRQREGDIPPEDTPEGRALEAQARAVQRSLAPGAAVKPTFIRSETNIPVYRSEGPVGVQRLVNEASDEDFTDLDLSDTDPEREDYRFAWQVREDEPTDVPWETRREWAREFEDTHKLDLQRARDERYYQLMAERSGEDGDSDELVREVRRQLDLEMPYQFGPPFGIRPYPELLPGEVFTDAPRTGAGRTGGTGGPSPTRTLTPITTPVTSTAAETSRANEVLRHITARAHEHHRTHGDYEGSLVEMFEDRFELERDMRWEVLSAKREAARAEGAGDDHVVELSDDEIARIHEAVDIEYPLPSRFTPQYLDEGFVRMSMEGVLDVPAPTRSRTPRTPGARTTGSPPTTTGPTTGPTSSTSTTPETPTAGAAEAQRRLEAIMGEARVRGENADGQFEGLSDLVGRYQQRFDYELSLRRRVLLAKVQGAVQSGAEAGTMVTLDQAEIDQIRQAVDIAYPLALDNLEYESSDEHLSHRITEEDVRLWRGTQPATPPETPEPTGEPETPTSTAEAPATTPNLPVPTTPAEAPVPEQAGGTGVGAGIPGLAAGVMALGAGVGRLVRSLFEEEPGAEDDLAVTVVDSLSDIELEILSRKLWERMRRELRTELLIDRERAGALADIR